MKNKKIYIFIILFMFLIYLSFLFITNVDYNTDVNLDQYPEIIVKKHYMEKYEYVHTKKGFSEFVLNENESIIIIYMGQQPSTAYGLKINKIFKYKNTIKIHINEWSGAVGGAMITHPKLILKINKKYDNLVVVNDSNESYPKLDTNIDFKKFDININEYNPNEHPSLTGLKKRMKTVDNVFVYDEKATNRINNDNFPNIIFVKNDKTITKNDIAYLQSFLKSNEEIILYNNYGGCNYDIELELDSNECFFSKDKYKNSIEIRIQNYMCLSRPQHLCYDWGFTNIKHLLIKELKHKLLTKELNIKPFDFNYLDSEIEERINNYDKNYIVLSKNDTIIDNNDIKSLIIILKNLTPSDKEYFITIKGLDFNGGLNNIAYISYISKNNKAKISLMGGGNWKKEIDTYYLDLNK